MSKLFIRLDITSHYYDANYIRNNINIIPTCLWSIGDLRIKNASIKHKNNGWCYECKYANYENFYEKLKDFIAIFRDDLENIRNISLNSNVLLRCIFYANESAESISPATYFDHEVINFLSKINGELDVDFIYGTR